MGKRQQWSYSDLRNGCHGWRTPSVVAQGPVPCDRATRDTQLWPFWAAAHGPGARAVWLLRGWVVLRGRNPVPAASAALIAMDHLLRWGKPGCHFVPLLRGPAPNRLNVG